MSFCTIDDVKIRWKLIRDNYDNNPLYQVSADQGLIDAHNEVASILTDYVLEQNSSASERLKCLCADLTFWYCIRMLDLKVFGRPDKINKQIDNIRKKVKNLYNTPLPGLTINYGNHCSASSDDFIYKENK